MLTRIEKKREFDYSYDFYRVEIATTKKLTKEEYTKIVNAMEDIAEVFDTYLTTKLAIKKKQ